MDKQGSNALFDGFIVDWGGGKAELPFSFTVHSSWKASEELEEKWHGWINRCITFKSH